LLGRLGLLAVACGDGNIYIYSVPEPDELAARFQSVSTGNEFNRQTRRLIVQLSPTVKISDMFNNQYLWCLQWSNDLVHSYLLTATVTGTVIVWDLHKITVNDNKPPEESPDQTRKWKIFELRSHSSAVKAISWAPMSCTLFSSCGYDGILTICHLSNPHTPIYSCFSSNRMTFFFPLLLFNIHKDKDKFLLSVHMNLRSRNRVRMDWSALHNASSFNG